MYKRYFYDMKNEYLHIRTVFWKTLNVLRWFQKLTWQSWLAGLYPHLAWDRLVAALPHPQTGLYPPSRHPFHSGADEVHGRTTVVADDLVERAQSCTNLSLRVVKVWNSQRGQSTIENSVLVWALSVLIQSRAGARCGRTFSVWDWGFWCHGGAEWLLPGRGGQKSSIWLR